MARLIKSSSFHKILILVFGIAFGLVALVLVYQSAKRSTEIRSKAAAEERLVQGWEFDGTTTEDWAGVNSTLLALKPIVSPNQALVVTPRKGSSVAEIQNNKIKTIPSGFKKVKLRFAVMTMSTMIVNPTGKIPAPRPSPIIKQYPFNGNIVFSGKKDSDSFTGIISGVADNQYHEYEVTLPQTLPVNATTLRIVLSGSTQLTVWVDWIHVLVTNPSVPTPPTTSIPLPTSKSTPLPTPIACKTVALASVSYTAKPGVCKTGYALGATYTCTDSYKGSFAVRICTLQSSLKSQASALCSKRTYCPTSTPSKYPTTYPTAYPTGGCITRCDVITKLCTTACPSTPYPTSGPTGPQPTYIPNSTPTPTAVCYTQCDINNNCTTVCQAPITSTKPTPTPSL